MNQLRTSTVLRLFIAAVLMVAMPACSKHGSDANSNIDYWTCTMHPSVHSKDPGKCPICGMTLVPVMKTAASAAPASPSADMKGMQGMAPGYQMPAEALNTILIPGAFANALNRLK